MVLTALRRGVGGPSSAASSMSLCGSPLTPSPGGESAPGRRRDRRLDVLGQVDLPRPVPLCSEAAPGRPPGDCMDRRAGRKVPGVPVLKRWRTLMRLGVELAQRAADVKLHPSDVRRCKLDVLTAEVSDILLPVRLHEVDVVDHHCRVAVARVRRAAVSRGPGLVAAVPGLATTSTGPGPPHPATTAEQPNSNTVTLVLIITCPPHGAPQRHGTRNDTRGPWIVPGRPRGAEAPSHTQSVA